MISENYIHILIILFLFFLVFWFAEFLYRRKTAQYITRKVVHIGGGVVASLLPIIVKLETVILLGVGFFLLLLFSKRKKLLNSIHETEDYSIGALLFAPSLTVSAIIFWPIHTLIFQGAALVLGLADGIAGIVGTKYGRKKYMITGKKTVEGSICFFVVTVFVLWGILYINGGFMPDKIGLVLASSLLLTAIEALFSKGWDNAFIPLASGAVLYFIL